MDLDDAALRFLQSSTSAAMITLRRDGQPHSVRVGIGVVDGRLLSSGTQSRARTRHLRRDPRCNLFVFNCNRGPLYLALDTIVTILDGDEVGDLTLRLVRRMQGLDQADDARRQVTWFGTQYTDAEFRTRMGVEGRLIYEFDILRAYGAYGGD